MMVNAYTLYLCCSIFATCDNKIDINCTTTLNNRQYLIIDTYISIDGYILNDGYMLNVTNMNSKTQVIQIHSNSHRSNELLSTTKIGTPRIQLYETCF